MIIPHPERECVWDEVAMLVITSGAQVTFFTATFPPHLGKQFANIAKTEAQVIRGSVDRPEIGYHILPINTASDIHSNTIALTNSLLPTLSSRDRILIFFQSTTDVEYFATKYGCPKYHAKLNLKAKHDNLLLWSQKSPVLAATTAAAVGVDQPYVKYVIIQQWPFGLVTFSQESGRGGRRGEHSYTILIHHPNVHQLTKGGNRDKHDLPCNNAMNTFKTQRIVCRRNVLLQTMDGTTRFNTNTCKDIPGCNPCDVCEPQSEIALLFKGAIANVNKDLKLYAQPVSGAKASPPALTAGPSRLSASTHILNESEKVDCPTGTPSEYGDGEYSLSFLQELQDIETKEMVQHIVLSQFTLLI